MGAAGSDRDRVVRRVVEHDDEVLQLARDPATAADELAALDEGAVRS
jgi:hypothetical protein